MLGLSGACCYVGTHEADVLLGRAATRSSTKRFMSNSRPRPPQTLSNSRTLCPRPPQVPSNTRLLICFQIPSLPFCVRAERDERDGRRVFTSRSAASRRSRCGTSTTRAGDGRRGACFFISTTRSEGIPDPVSENALVSSSSTSVSTSSTALPDRRSP